MYQSTIHNVNNSITVYGYQALAYSNIENVYNLYIDGTYGFEGSNITHVHNIKINGTNSLKGSIITSNLANGGDIDDNVFTIEVYGNNSESYSCYILRYLFLLF